MNGLNYNFTYPLSVSLNANERREVALTIDNDSSFLIEKLMSYHDGAYNALIRDTSKNLGWSNIQLRTENLFGTAQFPNRLQTPILLPPSSTIYLDLQDLSGLANDIDIAFEGYRIYKNDLVPPKRRFYVYALNMQIPALNVVDTSLVISPLGDFHVEKMVRYYDNDGVAVRMAASGLGGRALNNVITNVDNIFGNTLNPNILKHPYILTKNSIISIYALNRTADINNVQLCFEGSLLLE